MTGQKTAARLQWWAALWATPQATQWNQSGVTLVPVALLFESMQRAVPREVAVLSAQMMQHLDRHGLNPKAMLQLRWMLEAEAEDAAARKSPPRKRAAKSRLTVVA